jgi:hypothetical protein
VIGSPQRSEAVVIGGTRRLDHRTWIGIRAEVAQGHIEDHGADLSVPAGPATQRPEAGPSRRVTGAVFAAAFLGIVAGSQQDGAIGAIVILAFTAAVVLGWTWLSAMQLQLTKEVAQ